MKIALVVHDFDSGLGQGRYCVELARRMAARHEVTVYANTFGVEIQSGWRFVRVPAVRSNAISLIVSFLLAAEARVRRGGHDLVHAQGLTCWQADVITAHVCNQARYRVAPPARWRDRLFPALIIPLEARFYRQRRARHAIAVSRQVADELRDCYGWMRPCSVIHHGVDADVFRPAATELERRSCRRRFGLPETGWIWLFVGEAVKGLREVIERLPEFPGARLLVVSRSAGDPYTARARAMGVADRLHFWGPEPDVAGAYRAADVFVYPSSYDTFGMVVSEAMASGLPVVIGRDIGAAELIEPGVNGFLVDPSRGGEIRAALQELESVPGRAREVGMRARSTAEHQSWDANARQTEEIYSRLVGAGR